MDVIIAYSIRKQTPKDFERYFNKDIKLIRVQNFTRSINPIKDIKAILEVKKLIKDEKPDIVHMHSSKAGAIGRLVISPKQANLFYTPHSYAFCKKDESKLKVKFYKMVESLLGKRKCMTIACSKGEYEEALQLTKNCMYINNGIDINEMNQAIFGEREKRLDRENLKICTVGRIGPQKNPALFNQIAERFPTIQFTWIGDGELREVLKSPNIKVSGWLERKKTIQELYQNDVFILPSLWEGLPITLLEAMYLKKICLVSDVMGNRDVVKQGEDGFICQTETEYCQIIETIKNGKIDYFIMQNRAREKILANHNMDKIAEEYLKIYSKGDGCY